jgi:Tfp pilus assembly protein PilN
MAAAATARWAVAPARAPSRKAPTRKKPVALKVAPARQIPARKVAPARRAAPARRPGGQLIPIAVGTATAVRHLPDSGLVVRMTRGRVWIGVLGVLLVGIVAVNVITLSLAASAGHVDQNIMALEQENSLLRSRDAERSGVARVRHEAAGLGLAPATTGQIDSVQAGPRDIAVAAQRLAAAGTGY